MRALLACDHPCGWRKCEAHPESTYVLLSEYGTFETVKSSLLVPTAWSFCRVLGGGVFSWARYRCRLIAGCYLFNPLGTVRILVRESPRFRGQIRVKGFNPGLGVRVRVEGFRPGINPAMFSSLTLNP